MQRWTKTFLGQLAAWACCLAACFGTACIATPLPVPPTADPARMIIVDEPGGVAISGESDAMSPAPADYRITWEPPPGSIAVPARVQLTTAADGSFPAIVLPGARTHRYHVELLTEDDDVYVIAFIGGPADRAIETEPGPDGDGDGSPDAIDCAPSDPTQLGRRCP